MREKKNYGKSVRARLINLINETSYKYMYLLARYFNERLLYRVSASQYKNNFLLKGGSLLYALNGLEARPTVDVDFMADRISRDRENLMKVFKQIIEISCDEDGVQFDTESIKAEPITMDKKYPGVRFYITAHKDTIVHNMSIDIGFGDVVSPCPMTIDFPLLLGDIPSVNLQAYSLETVVAEKFQTMIDRDEANSRMKDFFDCYQLFLRFDINEQELYQAIKATFSNRQLENTPGRMLFTTEFANGEERNINWNSFLRKIHWKEKLDFPTVMNLLRQKLKPLEERYWKEMG